MNQQRPVDRSGLSRGALVDAAVGLLGEAGIEGLSMRALAERLGVKAASLYWHVRDRDELLDLIASSVLAGVRGPADGPWRTTATGWAGALNAVVAARPDAARVVLAVPDALDRSAALAGLAGVLEGAGLPAGDARETARLVLGHVLLAAVRGEAPRAPAARAGRPASIAVDAGSRGIVLRAGPAGMDELASAGAGSTAAPSVSLARERVVVRRRRGVGQGEVLLNPAHPWSVTVKAPTWNTTLDLSGLDVRRVDVDGGASRIEAFLPPPRGAVPVHVSSGVAGVRLHRAPGTAVTAEVSSGVIGLRLDAFSAKAIVLATSWETPGASSSDDRYELKVSSGIADLSLDVATPPPVPGRDPRIGPEPVHVDPLVAVEVALDGVEARLSRR